MKPYSLYDQPSAGLYAQPMTPAAPATLSPLEMLATKFELQFQFLLDNTAPETLASPDLVLVCADEIETRAYRFLLDQRGLGHVATRVAAPKPTRKQNRAQRAAARRRALNQR